MIISFTGNSLRCPGCGNSRVSIYDNGPKFLLRKILGSNRYFCKDCMLTWRGRDPQDICELTRKLK